MIEALKAAVLASIRDKMPDLTLRQLGVFLQVYLKPDPHTVRGLAETLTVNKSAITRAIDRLTALHLVRRIVDPDNERNRLILRTSTGEKYLNQLCDWLQSGEQCASSHNKIVD